MLQRSYTLFYGRVIYWFLHRFVVLWRYFLRKLLIRFQRFVLSFSYFLCNLCWNICYAEMIKNMSTFWNFTIYEGPYNFSTAYFWPCRTCGVVTWLLMTAFDQAQIYTSSAYERSQLAHISNGSAFLVIVVYLTYTMLPMQLHWVSNYEAFTPETHLIKTCVGITTEVTRLATATCFHDI